MTALEHTKNYTYLGLHINTTGNFHKAVNDLRDKARRAFYAIKRNIKPNLPIRSWLKILPPMPSMVVRSGVHSPTKNSQNKTNTQLRLCIHNYAKMYFVYNAKYQTMHAE